MADEDVMTTDRELWACALHVLGTHGEEAIAFVADRVAAVARAGDEAGIRTWRMIADRIDALRDRTKGTPH
jgi:N-acetylglucosamine kinase-like BadF-type ATPase